MKGKVERDLDAAAERLKSAGGAFAWSQRRISGYPFHLDVDFTGLVWRGPDGWGLSTPELRSETSVFAFGHWVAFAPAGASLIRPKGGEVRIAARVLRASVSDISAHPPTFSLEGQDLVFTPAPGAAPYFLASASELHVHTRAGPSDQGAFLVEFDNAKAAHGSKLAALAADGSVNFSADAVYDHAGALAGPGWTPAARSWTVAGGNLQVRRLRLRAGPFAIDGHGEGITLDPDGRLAGELDSVVTHGESALSALAATGAMKPDVARTAGLVLDATHAEAKGDAILDFQAGRMTLGPVALGPAPKVY